MNEDNYLDDPCEEPIGSCENCGSDLYEDDHDGLGFCDECDRWIYKAGE